MKHFKIVSFIVVTLSVGIILFSCQKDDEVKIPKISFENPTYSISETSTSALEVKVLLSDAASNNLTINYSVAGTAVAGTHYDAFTNTSISIAAGKTEAIIFVNAINESAIEGDKTIELTLLAGSEYLLSQSNTSTVITIEDNTTAPGDAPVVQFTSDNVITNAYMRDTIDVRIGLDIAFDHAVNIPITFAGTASKGTDYEILDLNEAEEFEMTADNIAGKFRIVVKYNEIVDLNKTIAISFTEPMVTDYAVSETNNTAEINIIDPVADMSAWFNETTKFNYFYAGGSSLAYRDDLLAYNINKRYYWDPVTEGGSYKIFSGEHHFAPSQTRYNTWEEVINIFQKLVGWPSVDIPEQERWELNPGASGDYFGLTNFFPNLATYSKTLIRSEKGWLRFVATDAAASEGKVYIEPQTLTVYKIKAGFDWKQQFTDGTENWYAWYADANATQGHLDQSSNVEPVSVEILGGEGSYSNSSGEIIFDITFTCSDVDFSIDPIYYIAKDGDTYTMRIKYIK